MDWPFDNNVDLLPSPSPSPSHNVQPSLLMYQDDREIAKIYDYLTDFSTFQPSNSAPTNTSNAIVDQYPQSITVNPTFPSKPTPPHETRQSSQEQLVLKSDKIKIETQPRAKFRPRTEKESLGASHYIRCDDSVEPEYPTIKIPQSWKNRMNLIKVTLVDKDKNPHPYVLENKERKTSDSIFKTDEPNSLFFHVTDQDFEQEQKTFLIEFIKLKQSEIITKEVIRTQQLYRSMLCFQRFYKIDDQKYQLDESSTEYSILMTEDFGSIRVDDIFPLYGPMSGNTKVCVEFKGILFKDLTNDIKIRIISNEFRWLHEVTSLKKCGNCINFPMPKFPFENIRHTRVTILINSKEDVLYQANYLYTQNLDEELNSVCVQSTSSNKRLRQ